MNQVDVFEFLLYHSSVMDFKSRISSSVCGKLSIFKHRNKILNSISKQDMRNVNTTLTSFSTHYDITINRINYTGLPKYISFITGCSDSKGESDRCFWLALGTFSGLFWGAHLLLFDDEVPLEMALGASGLG